MSLNKHHEQSINWIFIVLNCNCNTVQDYRIHNDSIRQMLATGLSRYKRIFCDSEELLKITMLLEKRRDENFEDIIKICENL